MWCSAALRALVLLAAAAGGPAAADADADRARELLRLAGVRAGLCVHLGRGDGRTSAELARAGGLLVHALVTRRDDVAPARAAIERLGVYGLASVDCAGLAPLPYADGMVNLLIADDLPSLLKAGLGLDEVARVLSGGGVALLDLAPPAMTVDQLRRHLPAAAVADLRPVGPAGRWARLTRARPPGEDDWTHRTYDAGGNCVSRDTAIGPLASLRWIAGPAWPMGTGYQVSNAALLAAGGRLFSVTLNESSNAHRLPQQRNDEWFLTARDARNGLLLWSRPVGRKMTRDGQEFGHYLVAGPRRLYALLGEDLLALDPATGRTLTTCRKSVPLGGRLLLTGPTLVLATPSSIGAIDANTAQPRWLHDTPARDVLAAAGRVLYAAPACDELVCLDLATGRRQWSADLRGFQGRKKQLLLAAAGVAVFVWERDWQKGANGIAVFSAADGRKLWSAEYASSRATWADTVWCVGGLLWRREGAAGLVGLDPATGVEKRRVTIQGGYCGGCVRNIATTQYLLSTRPPNFIDWSDGQVHPFRAARHACRAGVIVANGMLYTQPHGCKCVRESLRGFLAFAPAGQPEGEGEPATRLERGPAADAPPAPPGEPTADEWPTFRRDSRRTGSAPAGPGPQLEPLWRTNVDDQHAPAGPLGEEWLSDPLGPDRLTAPVAAEGIVALALRDAHRAVALDAASGRVRWTFMAGGRIDTPPTIHRGLCLLGSYDGWVYCLRATDGALVWRLRAAPAERRIVAFGQLESPWPVVGGVMVEAGVAYFVAGRSTAADGGIVGWAVEPSTGRVLWRAPVAGASSDLLVADGGAIRMAGGGSAGFRFDPKTGQALRSLASSGFQWDYAGKIGTLWGGPNRVLDRTWHVLSVNDTASRWMRIKQGYGPHEGQLLVASPDLRRVFGFRFKPAHWSKAKDPATEIGGELVAWEAGREVWKADVPGTLQVEALALAGDVLFAAGPVDRFRRKPGGRLWAVSAADGITRAEYALDAPPAADGIAISAGRLVLTTADGSVLCYGRTPRDRDRTP